MHRLRGKQSAASGDWEEDWPGPSLGAFLPSDHSAEIGDAGPRRTSGDNRSLILVQKFIIRGHSKGVLGRENSSLPCSYHRSPPTPS